MRPPYRVIVQALPTHKRMYDAMLRRDAAYDGVFFTAVKTTGIFCRPTCSAKKPHKGNVEFFATVRECLLAGYRPCQRCRPMDRNGAPPRWVQQLIAVIERNPASRISAAELRNMSIDPARVRRYFNKEYGMTFHAYHRMRRMGLAMAAVRAGDDVDRVASRHGFASTSGFRDAFAKAFGQPPGARSRLNCLLARWLSTPLGPMLAVADDEGLCLLEFLDRRMLQTQLERIRRRLGAAIVPGGNRHLDSIERELSQYFDGSLTRFATPLVLRGTPFQTRVWQRLMKIPYGETTSYSAMAADLGVDDARRAVGRANGDNRLAIIIPCHRVIKADGTLCGYGGGLWRKKWLLEHERAHAAHDRGLHAATQATRLAHSLLPPIPPAPSRNALAIARKPHSRSNRLKL